MERSVVPGGKLLMRQNDRGGNGDAELIGQGVVEELVVALTTRRDC